MKRLGRFRFVVYALVTVLLVCGAVRLFLSSSFVAARVAAKLSTMLGAPVQVAAVDIALRGDSSLKVVKVLESDGAASRAPWLTAPVVRADVSVASFLRDDTDPREVTLVAPALVLRFDAANNLLTQMPKPTGGAPRTLPGVRIENGTLTLSQEGHVRPFVVENINGSGDSAGRVLTFAGDVHDPYWGDWTVTGRFDAKNSRCVLRLHTDRIEATQEKLDRLPFVSAGVWEEIGIEQGVSNVDLTLTVQSESPRFSYHIEMEPRNTRMHIAAIDLDADQALGKVVIDNELVELHGATAHTAGGTVSTEAKLDFRSEPSRLSFSPIRLDGVELQDLPDSWKLKEYEIAGKLTGQAKLDVRIKPGGKGIETSGSGEGVITDATFRNLPLSEPIKLRLHPVGNKFRFQPEKHPIGRLLPLQGWFSSLARSASDGFRRLRSRYAGAGLSRVGRGARISDATGGDEARRGMASERCQRGGVRRR